MKRVIAITSLTFFSATLWQALAVFMPYSFNVLCLPPIILAFSLQFYKPLETIWVSLLCGGIIDVLGGFSMGVNMTLMLIFAFVAATTNLFMGRLTLRELSIYAGVLSILYRLAFFLIGLVALRQKTNVSIGQLIFGPFLDVVLGYFFYVILVKILVAFKSFERSDFAKYGLGI